MRHELMRGLRLGACLLSLSLALGACGGGGDGGSATVAASLAPVAQALGLSISGYPSAQAVAGQPYSFAPVVRGSNGHRLAFTVEGKPGWASFDVATGRLWGTPQASDIGMRDSVGISVSDGVHRQALPEFALTVLKARKSSYGHYFSLRYSASPGDAAMLCEQPGVTGLVWRGPWNEIEPAPGVFNFDSLDATLAAIAGSRNPHCQLWLMVEFKSFRSSPVKNPCPAYLQAQYSAENSDGGGAASCFMWDPVVTSAYVAMMQAAAARYDGNPRVEGLLIQESSLGFNGPWSQDLAAGGSYTPGAWRDALIGLVDQCAASFASSRCAVFLNFLRGGQSYLYDISAAITAVPENQVCISGPDLLPDSPELYARHDAIYQVIARHSGCRSNSAQNASYQVPGCTLECIFDFAVGGTLGAFPTTAPLLGGLCVNSYIFWNDHSDHGPLGHDWREALAVIAAHPYGADWLDHCAGSDGRP